MTQEEKELLLVDLSSRLPYNVNCKVKYVVNNETTDGRDVNMECTDVIKRINFDRLSVYTENLGYESDVEDIRPYLRPMSSMTEEEENEWNGLIIDPLFEAVGGQHTRIEDLMLRAKSQYNPIDWLNAHHFDYRGLIEKGLAIAVTEDNNPYKD